jgi:(S)-sulfolactate dehydrogenase
MKREAVLIDTARGGVVDENALARHLREGRIAGAALDVFSEEPLTGEAASRFAGLENVLLTPHIAGVTHESNVRVSQATAENVRRVLEEHAR